MISTTCLKNRSTELTKDEKEKAAAKSAVASKTRDAARVLYVSFFLS